MATVYVKDVTKNYEMGKVIVQALKGINLTIGEGEFVTIAGASGSGKSTLLNLIGCLDKSTGGEIRIGDTIINNLSEAEMNRLRLYTIGFIFQSFNLIPVLNIFENIELPLLIMKEVTPQERKERVNYFVKAVGLEDQIKRKPSELSGGQRQRVAVARALVTKPKIVLADEPTANLDSKTGIEIIELMHEISRRESTTFIFSTHDPKVMQRADKIYVMQDGLLRYEEKP